MTASLPSSRSLVVSAAPRCSPSQHSAPPEELLTELADVLEVFDTILATHGLTLALIQVIQRQRHQPRGGFESRPQLD